MKKKVLKNITSYFTMVIIIVGFFCFVDVSNAATGSVSTGANGAVSTGSIRYETRENAANFTGLVDSLTYVDNQGNVTSLAPLTIQYNRDVAAGRNPSFSALLTQAAAPYGGVQSSTSPTAPGSTPTTPTPGQMAEATVAEDKKADIGVIKPCIEMHGYVPWINFDGCLASIANLALQGASYVLWATASVFNITLGYSLNFGVFLSKMQIVDTGWRIFRDLANIAFIFILLALGIGTILQRSDFDGRKLLVKVVIAALFINFSLFFTKVVIDVSNILALSVYQKMTISGTELSSDPAANSLSGADQGISTAFIRGLGIESIYSSAGSNSSLATNIATENKFLSTWNVAVIGIGGTILILIVAFVFLVATVLFISRTIVLMFLMMLSPLAFASTALPQLQKHFSKWWGMLVGEAFFAPFYMILLFVVFSFISQSYTPIGSTKPMNFASFLTGSQDAIATAFTFVIIIGFMIGGLIAAKGMGGMSGNVAQQFTGKIALGGSAWMGRQFGGRFAKYAQQSGFVTNLASQGGYKGLLGRSLEKGLGGVAASSFDARAFGGGVLGKAGGAGGYAKSAKDSQKAWEDQKKRISTLSSGEEAKLANSEESKKNIEAVRAAALLREIEEAESNSVPSQEEKDRKKEEIEAIKNEMKSYEAEKLKAEEKKKKELEEAAKIGDQKTREDKIEKANEKYNQTIKPFEDLISIKEKEVEVLETDVKEIDKVLGEFASSIKEKEEMLKKIDKDYEVGGDNTEIRNKIKEEAKKSMGHVEKMKLTKEMGLNVGKADSASLAMYSNMIQKNIMEIEGGGKSRGKQFASASALDRVFSPGKVAMIRAGREDGRKNKDKKFIEQVKKYMKEQDGGDEKKDDKKNEPKEEKH